MIIQIIKKKIGWEIARRGILVTDNKGERAGETTHLATAMEAVLDSDELSSRIVNVATEWIESRSNTEILQQ